MSLIVTERCRSPVDSTEKSGKPTTRPSTSSNRDELPSSGRSVPRGSLSGNDKDGDGDGDDDDGFEMSPSFASDCETIIRLCHQACRLVRKQEKYWQG